MVIMQDTMQISNALQSLSYSQPTYLCRRKSKRNRSIRSWTLSATEFYHFFITIENLFNNLRDIFDNIHQKERIRKKFWEIKTRIKKFKDFDFELIQLPFNLKHTSERLILKYQHKLTSRQKNWFNSQIKLPTFKSALAKYYLSINKQIQTTDKICNWVKFEPIKV